MKRLLPFFLLLAIGILIVTFRDPIFSRGDDSLAAGVVDYSGKFDENAKVATFEDQELTVPLKELAAKPVPQKVLGESAGAGKWIEVSLSQQHLWAWDGNQLYLDTPISTGLPAFPTPTGEYRIWTKIRYVHMVGGYGRYYYNLPNVPFVMFFSNDKVAAYKGYSLHGTYWHHDFGKVHSHGCVNLPTPIAEKLYYWTTPDLPAGKSSTPATADNPGTRIVIHG
jgi:lipoprotein-anchoring transpeptidase ErfK/SrfK